MALDFEQAGADQNRQSVLRLQAGDEFALAMRAKALRRVDVQDADALRSKRDGVAVDDDSPAPVKGLLSSRHSGEKEREANKKPRPAHELRMGLQGDIRARDATRPNGKMASIR